MAQQVCAARPEELSLLNRPDVVEGENNSHRMSSDFHTCALAYTHPGIHAYTYQRQME